MLNVPLYLFGHSSSMIDRMTFVGKTLIKSDTIRPGVTKWLMGQAVVSWLLAARSIYQKKRGKRWGNMLANELENSTDEVILTGKALARLLAVKKTASCPHPPPLIGSGLAQAEFPKKSENFMRSTRKKSKKSATMRKKHIFCIISPIPVFFFEKLCRNVKMTTFLRRW